MPKDEAGQMAQFAESLLKKTKSGEAQWVATDDDRTFLYAGANSSLLIEGDPDDEDDPYSGEFTLRLLNRTGNSVAELNNEDGTNEDSPRACLLADLYYLVREKTLMVEDTFADMRNSLEIADK